MHGIGYDVAAKMLVAAGDNPGRLRSEAAFAHLCGVAPLEASSGKTRRHRLNRGGDRQANNALYHVVITRMSSHPATKVYVARRRAEGKSTGEIVRILKRYVAREAFKHLRPDEPMNPAEADQPSTGRETGLHNRLTATQPGRRVSAVRPIPLADAAPQRRRHELNPPAPETTVAV